VIAVLIKKAIAFIPKMILVGIILVLVPALGFQSCTVKRQVAEVAKARVAVDAAKVVNVANVETIDDLGARLRASIDGRRTDETAHKTAVDKWQVERELLEVLANETETIAVEVYRDPTCAELAKTSITNICPDFVNGMRQRADSLNASRN